MASVELSDAVKTFPNGAAALCGVSLEIADGELAVLVGPSGCGKTTALRTVAGLERLSSGSVRIDGEDVDGVEPADRDVAMVFQSYALYPSMSVARNISFGLRARGVPGDERERRVREIARVLDIEPLLDRKPRQLSGGQRQRVAMGRAIVREPRVFLMDEPLSNLDARLRVQTRGEIVRIQAELGTTMLYVTHDQVEAMTMGQRVAVMEAGRVRQFDAPQRLYDAPADTFVARFMGSPPMSLLLGEVSASGSALTCRLGDGAALALPARAATERPELGRRDGQHVIVGVRPDGFEIVAAGAPGALAGSVYLTELLGSEALVHVEVDADGVDGEPGRLTGRFDGRFRATPGDRVGLAIDPARIDYFDPASGAALERVPLS